MRHMRLFAWFLSCSSVVLCALSSQPSTSEISGTWSDACPCSIPCSCWRKHQSSAEFCVNFHVFKIRSGTYDGTNLAHSVFVLANLPRAPREAPVPDTLFIGTTDEKKASAIEGAVRRLLFFAPLRVLRTPIRYHETKNKQEVSIRGILLYKIDFDVQQPLSDEVRENLYPWLSDARQGIVKLVVYSRRDGKTIEYVNTNALWGIFRVPMALRSMR
jgi:hypothetical protein